MNRISLSSDGAVLTRDERWQVRWGLGGLLTLIAALAVGYADIDAGLRLSAIVVGVGATLAWPALPARIPRWAHRLAFPGAAAILAGDLWLNGEVLPAFVRLDLLLLLYRACTYRKRRDDLQLIVLGLFLVVVAGVLTVSPWFALHILAFTAGALALLLAVTLSPAEEAEPGGEDAAVPGWARDVRWGRLLRRWREATDWRMVALGGGLFAGLVALAALLFLAIPRFQLENSLWLNRLISRSAKTGFSETIRLGDVTEIKTDDAVVVSVDGPEPQQITAVPYWRMLVLDDYRDGTFRMSPELRRSAFSPERHQAVTYGGAPEKTGEPVYWTFYLEAGVSRHLPLPGTFARLQFREAQYFRAGESLGLVALRDEPVTMTAYRVEGGADAFERPDAAFGERLRAGSGRKAHATMLALGVDEADRATLERIDREIVAGAEPLSASAFADEASAWLARRHRYSLQPKIPAGLGDPLVRWMADNGGGHCELFAGSLVLLARAAGWPARLVTGFHGGTWNAYSNSLTLRNSDAHAWCELFDAATGMWVRADPTPRAGGEADGGRGQVAWSGRTDRSWTARFDSLRVFWYRRIVNFDRQTQVDAVAAVKAATQYSSEWLRELGTELGERLAAWFRAPWGAGRAAGWLGVAAGVAGAIWVGWRFRFAIGQAMPGRRQGDPVRAAAGRWLRRLRERGEDGDQDNAETIGELQRLRYGARETWPEPTVVFRRARRAKPRGRVAETALDGRRRRDG